MTFKSKSTYCKTVENFGYVVVVGRAPPASGRAGRRAAKGQVGCHEVCEGRSPVHCASGSRSAQVGLQSGVRLDYTPSRRQLCGRHHGVTMATGVASLPLPGSPRAGPAKLPRRPPPARAIHKSEARLLSMCIFPMQHPPSGRKRNK